MSFYPIRQLLVSVPVAEPGNTSVAKQIVVVGDDPVERKFAVKWDVTQVHAGTVDGSLDVQVGADYENDVLTMTQLAAPGTNVEITEGGAAVFTQGVRLRITPAGGGTYTGNVYLASNLPFSFL